MNAHVKIYLRRYWPFNTLEQPVFDFSPELGLTKFNSTQDAPISGWLVDCEKIIAGPNEIVFFELNSHKFIYFGENSVRIDCHFKLIHKRFIFSKLILSNSKNVILPLTYLTPWWRHLVSDGSHPDLLDPLKYFSEKWNSPKPFFAISSKK